MGCPHCADRSGAALARRAHVLQLLALIEHPDALPREDALRIAAELLRCAGDDDGPPAAQWVAAMAAGAQTAGEQP